MTLFIEKILNKTRKWVLPLAFLKAFFIFPLGLSQIVFAVWLWPLRAGLILLGLIGMVFGTLSIYLDLVGSVYYLVKRRKKDQIFLWALLPHFLYFFYVMLGNPIWTWDQDQWFSVLDYTFGGPFLWGKFFPIFLEEGRKIIFHPTYIPDPFNERGPH